MGDQQIDLSGGFVPKSAPASSSSGASGIDLSGGFVPKAPVTNTTIPAGHSAMTDDKGQLQAVPFADRAAKMQQGWKLGPPEQQHYDPLPEAKSANDYIERSAPWRGASNFIKGVAAMPGAIHQAFTAPPQTDQEKEDQAAGGSGAVAVRRLILNPMTTDRAKASQDLAQGHYSEAAGHGLAGVLPVAGSFASHSGEAIGEDPVAGGVELGLNLAAPKVLGEGLKLAKPIVSDAASAISDALPKSTPRSALSKTIKPADPVDFHAAEQSALPQIKQAAIESGQPIKSASDLLTTKDPETGTSNLGLIDKAKQNVLLDAHQSAGPGNTIADLPPEQLAKVKQDLTALDTLQKHIQTAQETAEATSAKPQPTTADSVKQIATGGAKVAAGAAVSHVPVVGQVGGMFGLFKGTPEIVNGVKGLLSKRALTPENLDSAIQQTFGNVEPAARAGSTAADVPAKVPYQPVAGDLTVQHEGNIQPPDLPHGDATVSPDRPNPALVSSGSTAEPLPSRPATMGPNVKPAASTTELDSTPKPVIQPTETAPPIKQPLKATTPAAQTAEVLKKAGVQQALKDAGVAAPSATIRQIRPGIDIGPTLQPRMDLTFYGDKTGEGAALMQLTRYNINELRAMAVSRGLDVAPGDSHVALIDKIHDDLSPAEIKEFNDAAAERGISPRPTQPKRGYRQQATAQPQAAEEPPASAAPQTDRRQNVDLRSAVDAMSPEDQVKAIYQSDKTGLPNKRAFEWAENTRGPAKAIGMSDSDGLKAMNDNYGYAAGNSLLKAKADALQQAGLEAYHLQGDEFAYRGDSTQDVAAKLEKARDILRNTVIEVKMDNGKVAHFSGADFTPGVGKDLISAEAAMHANKAARKASGAAGERGQMGNIKKVEP